MSQCRFRLSQAVFRKLAVFCLVMVGAGSSQCTVGQAREAYNLCDDAAVSASRQTGVPLSVLHALTRTETGRTRNGRYEPWPWTVNMEGVGTWFPDPDSALSHVFEHIKRGARSFDVGCFQINHKWHGGAFSSVQEMFDPEKNALYAARFLSALHDEFGDWMKAVGAYHSRTPELARRYSARFDRIHRVLQVQAPEQSVSTVGRTTARNPRIDLHAAQPLTGGVATLTRGSLVPLGGGMSRPFLLMPD